MYNAPKLLGNTMYSHHVSLCYVDMYTTWANVWSFNVRKSQDSKDCPNCIPIFSRIRDDQGFRLCPKKKVFPNNGKRDEDELRNSLFNIWYIIVLFILLIVILFILLILSTLAYTLHWLHYVRHYQHKSWRKSNPASIKAEYTTSRYLFI